MRMPLDKPLTTKNLESFLVRMLETMSVSYFLGLSGSPTAQYGDIWACPPLSVEIRKLFSPT